MAFARVTVVASGLEAEMVCALLRTEGIECFTRHTDEAVGFWQTGAGGAHEVVAVHDDDLSRAREIVEASRRQ
jgi:Putative prokaryotic signal transducing protein